MKARDDESEGPARRASSPPPPPQRRLPGTKGESGRALRYPTSPPASWTHPPTARAGRASAPAAPDWNRLRYSSLAWSVAIRAIRARVAGTDVYSVAERPGAESGRRRRADRGRRRWDDPGAAVAVLCCRPCSASGAEGRDRFGLASRHRCG